MKESMRDTDESGREASDERERMRHGGREGED